MDGRDMYVLLFPEAKEFREATVVDTTGCNVSYEMSELFGIDITLSSLNRQLIENSLESAITSSNVNMTEASIWFS